jgi:hypothetical protein
MTDVVATAPPFAASAVAVEEADGTLGNSLEYAAVRYLLISPSISQRTTPHIGRDDFDWNGLFEQAAKMSSGESLLIRIACDLWAADGTVAISEVARNLDRASFQRVVTALSIYRGDLVYRGDLAPTAGRSEDIPAPGGGW